MKNRYLYGWLAVLTALVIFLLVISFFNRNEIDKVRVDIFLNEAEIEDNTEKIQEIIESSK